MNRRGPRRESAPCTRTENRLLHWRNIQAHHANRFWALKPDTTLDCTLNPCCLTGIQSPRLTNCSRVADIESQLCSFLPEVQENPELPPPNPQQPHTYVCTQARTRGCLIILVGDIIGRYNGLYREINKYRNFRYIQDAPKLNSKRKKKNCTYRPHFSISP